MKRLTLAAFCDVAGCATQATERGASKGEIVGVLVGQGWRFGALRDICPACHALGHRP